MSHILNVNGTITEYATLAEYEAAVAAISTTDIALISRLVEAERAERIGRDLLKDLYQTLKQQNLTQAQEADLMNRIFQVLTVIGLGFLRGARDMCNVLPVAGQLTTGRKNFLLAAIDAAIVELNA